ncbi:MAG: alpha-galactosidase [Clostridia bacterium]|nr:alpha-galactosidase [Clostridia bacterium]
MYFSKAEHVFLAYGSFERVYGELQITENGACYKNSDVEITCNITKSHHGIYERRDVIRNISKRKIDVTTALSRFTLNGGEYSVYTQTNKHICEGIGEWQPLVTGVFGMSDEARTNQDVNPFVAVYNHQTKRGYAFHIMAESMFEYRVHKHSEFLDNKVVIVDLGIKGENLSYELLPGQSLTLPAIIYYQFENTEDLDAYKLHRYCNERYKKELPVVYNSWMNKFDYVEFEDLSAQLEIAKDLGCEYFTVDAGWFGPTQDWWLVVGDWEESVDNEMAGRLKEFSDLVRQKGLKFGLWFEIERAGLGAKSVKERPELYVRDGDHYFIDYSNRDACDYIYSKLKKNIDKYGIEFIKFDLNAPYRFDKSRHAFIDYYGGYTAFLKRIKQEYPSLHLECCASGGGRMSLSNVPYFDSFWMSDNHGIYPQLEIFKNTIKRMPSSILERWATIRSVEGFTPSYPVGSVEERILLSSHANWVRLEEASLEFIKNALVGGPIGISCDLTQVSKDTIKGLKEFISEYKKEREFWQGSECRILCDTKTLLALQFNNRDFSKIKIYTYTKHPNQEQVLLYPILGTDDAEYVKKGEGVSIKATELLENGLTFVANLQNQSQVIELERA